VGRLGPGTVLQARGRHVNGHYDVDAEPTRARQPRGARRGGLESGERTSIASKSFLGESQRRGFGNFPHEPPTGVDSVHARGRAGARGPPGLRSGCESPRRAHMAWTPPYVRVAARDGGRGPPDHPGVGRVENVEHGPTIRASRAGTSPRGGRPIGPGWRRGTWTQLGLGATGGAVASLKESGTSRGGFTLNSLSRRGGGTGRRGGLKIRYVGRRVRVRVPPPAPNNPRTSRTVRSADDHPAAPECASSVLLLPGKGRTVRGSAASVAWSVASFFTPSTRSAAATIA
jgi:hypothetical protein